MGMKLRVLLLVLGVILFMASAMIFITHWNTCISSFCPPPDLIFEDHIWLFVSAFMNVLALIMWGKAFSELNKTKEEKVECL